MKKAAGSTGHAVAPKSKVGCCLQIYPVPRWLTRLIRRDDVAIACIFLFYWIPKILLSER